MTACTRRTDGAAISESSPYLYSEGWKSAVDRDGPEWRSYCEALWRVKRFLRIELVEGRKSAVDDYHRYLGLLGAGEKARPARALEAIARLQVDFNLIGIHEGRQLREEVSRDLEHDQRSKPETSSEMPMPPVDNMSY